MNDLRTPDPVIGLMPDALARLMPMHLLVSEDGCIAGVGPTLDRLVSGRSLVGGAFFRLFRIRRPAGIATLPALAARAGERLDLAFCDGPPTALRGLAVPQAGGGLLINLSFGIGVIEAVRRHHLTDADFPPTDLTVEMLYVVEAKSAVTEELRDLNLRLRGAKSLAEEQALTDTLTGLRNRRALEAAMQRLLRDRVPFGLMHMDLDFFKQVNDSFGHAAGDHVLVRAAAALTDETRAGDTVARIGGDEFVILLPMLTGADSMMAIAQRIIARLSEPIPFEGHVCRISASVGLVLSGDLPSGDPAQILARADGALYAAKHAGRGVARLYRP